MAQFQQHQTRNEVVLMWNEKEDVRFNVRKGTTLNVGDLVYFKNKNETLFYFEVNEIISTRPATVSGYDYVTTKSNTVKGQKTTI